MWSSSIIGNLGSDAVIKDFGGRKYVTFNVAHSYRHKDAAGNYVNATQWVSAMWYGDGGNLLQYLKKGVKVFVYGRTSVKPYTRQDGSVDVGVNIDVTEIQLCGSKGDGSDQTPSTPAPATASPAAPGSKSDDPNDDLPF